MRKQNNMYSDDMQMNQLKFIIGTKDLFDTNDIITSGCGMQSDAKQKLVEALHERVYETRNSIA